MDCVFFVICFNIGLNVQIVGNFCFRLGEIGIYLEFGFQGVLIVNNIVDGGIIGIFIVNFVDGGWIVVCFGNIICNIFEMGFYLLEIVGFGYGIVVEVDVIVIGNVIEGVLKFGLMLGWGFYMCNVVVLQNVLCECGIGIVVSVVDGVGLVVIISNIIQGVKFGVINGYWWFEKVIGEFNDGLECLNLIVCDN